MKPIKFLFATMIAVLALVTLPSCSDDKTNLPYPRPKPLQAHTQGIWNAL